MEWTHPDKELFEKKKADFDFNFEIIKERIAEAAKISGREQKDIKLLAATKTVSPELINYGLEKGIELIGENRVQELLSKKDELNTDKEHTHFIGHLQTNKINMLLPHVSMIESVGSIHLAEEISKKCIASGTVMPVLMEVNVGEEISKSGIAPNEAESAFEQMLSLGGIKVMGLMSIPPACENPDDARRYFSTIYKLFVDIKDKNRDNKDIMYLSMGMSGDYYEAISEGANIVRIGSALFGKRIYKK